MPSRRKQRIRSESEMANAVLQHLNKRKVIAGREVKLGRGRLDVVAYDKRAKTFKIIECKLSSRPTSVAKTFGQAVYYLTSLEKRVPEFLDAASRKLPPMRYARWQEATNDGKKITVAVYVALTHKACMQSEFRALRKQYPQIGVIRVRPNGRCRNALRRADGTADAKAANATPKTIRL